MGSRDVLVVEKESTIFANGAFVSGASGVTGAIMRGHEVVVSVGSGAYAFEVLS